MPLSNITSMGLLYLFDASSDTGVIERATNSQRLGFRTRSAKRISEHIVSKQETARQTINFRRGPQRFGRPRHAAPSLVIDWPKSMTLLQARLPSNVHRGPRNRRCDLGNRIDGSEDSTSFEVSIEKRVVEHNLRLDQFGFWGRYDGLLSCSAFTDCSRNFTIRHALLKNNVWRRVINYHVGITAFGLIKSLHLR